jgi:hypothetical protein
VRANPPSMTELQASRTLVKSPPELWAECSDAASLARHLGQFGEIRITRLEPETAVAWEGERARGTVRIEPAGWGTKVILTAVAVAEEALRPEDAPPREEASSPEEAPPPQEARRSAEPPARPRRRFARLLAFLRGPEPAAEPSPPPAVVAEAPAAVVIGAGADVVADAPAAVVADAPADEVPGPDSEAALAAALDSLGRAHHRPFSRV